MARLNLVGRRFGKLVVLEFAGSNGDRKSTWLCKCDCGSTKIVVGVYMTQGKTRSCGCLGVSSRIKHGLSQERINKIYRGMVNRATNPNNAAYANYGGRGITICDDWLGEEDGPTNFYNWAKTSGYAEGLTLDRENNNKGYSPDNCRWVTSKVQGNNRRTNVLLTFKGETKTLAEWSIALGGSRSLVGKRLEAGWSTERALETPVTPWNKCNTRMFTYQNKTQPLHAWSKELGINYETLAGRLKKGWSVEKTLSTPVRQRSTKPKKGEC
ncbi:HNH endonuclease [Bacillus phage Moonbeam]|uniref:HNH endonuclease n=1 Tax=Bacillus phage Moonbeam TaxID=1540091 RepID=A0A0A0RNF3_9CAUD|nr:HNH endonuclease [Bacillus phage Moonbeam]AIW03527.1 hypothetical protein CPT_Moonbeam129 [Bacillus phage Moonbeam]